jgi:hypothetical protein
MKIGAASIGYTSGTLYKRHKHSTYTVGSKFERFGTFGLLNQRNMRAMNREAVEAYNSSFSFAGTNMFSQKLTESEGLSEIAANIVLERVKAQTQALIDSSSALSLANGGSGGNEVSETDAESDSDTGNNVDETV